jgi:hypothetical protein
VVPVVVPLEPSSVSPLAVAPELLLIASVVLPVGPGPVVSSPVGSVLVGVAVESLEGSPGFAGVLLVLVVVSVLSLSSVVSVESTGAQAERLAPSKKMLMSVMNDGYRMRVKLSLVGAMTRGARDTSAARV